LKNASVFMKLCIFGHTISSSWDNRHASVWRGLCRSLARLGHRVVFFERDHPQLAAQRDVPSPEGCDLRIYRDWDEVRANAARELADSDAGLITTRCRDARAVTDLLLDAELAVAAFYDLEAPQTLARRRANLPVEHIGDEGYAPYDLVLSSAGGAVPREMVEVLGARRVATLFEGVDPAVHQPDGPVAEFTARASFLGAYSHDLHGILDRLFFEPSRRLSEVRFALGGGGVPDSLLLPTNLRRFGPIAPQLQASFYCSSRITVNVTPDEMARAGHCPSGRMFAAAGCGIPVLTDAWDGIEVFFEPGREIFVARSTEEAVEVLCLPDQELARVGRAARDRAMSEHTAEARARRLVDLFTEVALDEPG
jgi:spore maturation protein CgeB